MLNELYSVLLGMNEIGIDLSPVHNDIQSPGKGQTLRVLLSGTGAVEKVILVQREEFSDIWTIGNGNKNQFPAVKLVAPLRPDGYRAFEQWKKENGKASEKAWLEKIEFFRTDFPINLSEMKFWPSYRDKIENRCGQLSDLQNTRADCVIELYRRYLNAPNFGVSILSELDEALWKSCTSNPDKDLLRVAAAVFFGDSLKDGVFPDGKRVTLILDFFSEEAGRYASSRKWVTAISKALDTNAKPSVRQGLCPLSATRSDLLEEKFPKEKLPVIGNTFLYSRYDGSGNSSVQRYGFAGNQNYAVSADIASQLSAVLVKLTDASLNKKTWDSIPSEAKGPDLLLAFCRDRLDMELCPFLTGESPSGDYVEDDVEDFSDYQTVCTGLINKFKGDNQNLSRFVNFLIVRKINDGNQKIIFSTSKTVSQLTNASDSWIKGCRNVPSIKLKAKINKKIAFVAPWPVSPKELVSATRAKYIRDGSTSTEVPAASFSEAARLFFSVDNLSSETATHLLRRMISQYATLLELAAQAKHQMAIGRDAVITCDPNLNRNALVAVTCLGLLLHKIGRTKEIYMNDLAYKLGQFLAAADELHIGYCHDMRGKQIPNTLIGNQAYGMALQSPGKAFDFLASRLKPYQGWARTKLAKVDEIKEIKNEPIKNALYAYLWFSEMAGDLKASLVDLSKLPTDSFKVELMLGYMAGRFVKSSKNSENASDANAKGEKNGSAI